MRSDLSQVETPGGGAATSVLYTYSGSDPDYNVPLYDIFGPTIELVDANNRALALEAVLFDFRV